ncbi:MFS transporter [Dermacoccaceae bacterium W4C1]
MTSSATQPKPRDLRPNTSTTGVIVVLAGGILLQALNMYLTSALMPSIVNDIGGQDYYAWVTTVFIVASVAATMAVPTVLARLGSRSAYLLAAGAFGLGSAVAAIAPAMELLLVGRLVQGVGGGLLSGLAFALIRSALPQEAWGKGTAIISAMFGVGTLAGPALGGAFAQFDGWRLAFGLVAGVAVVLGFAATTNLPRSPRAASAEGLPWPSLAALTASVAALSLAGVLPGEWFWAASVVGGLLLVVFVAVDRAARSGVLPSVTYEPGALKWIYIALALTTTVTASEAFTPLFGQRMFALEPFAAGFLGATVSAGWAVTALMSARVTALRAQRRMTLIGPGVTAVAMIALALLQFSSSTVILIGWIVILIIAGVGTGLSNPHLSVRVMSSVGTEADGAKAAAAIPVASLIGQAIFAALGGSVVNAGLPSYPQAATNLFLLLGSAALLGVVAVRASTRRQVAVGGHDD